MLTLPKRKKTNFMIDNEILQELKEFIPEGQRSDFINESIQEAISTFKRKKAFEGIEELRQKLKLKMSMKEFKKLKNYGRK